MKTGDEHERDRLFPAVMSGCVLLGAPLCCAHDGIRDVDSLTWLDRYNVVWTSQSANSGESAAFTSHRSPLGRG
jgi:hypothetical protein